MKSLQLLLLFLITSVCARAQSDTIWFDDQWKPLESGTDASFYRPPVKKIGDKWLLSDYFINGQLQMAGLALDTSYTLFAGKTVYFYPNGDTLAIHQNEKNGQAISTTQYYAKGHKQNESVYIEKNRAQIKSFFYNGKIRQVGWYGENGWDSSHTVYFHNQQLKEISYYRKGVAVDTSKMFYPDGRLNMLIVYYDKFQHIYFKSLYPDGSTRMQFERNGNTFLSFFASYTAHHILWEWKVELKDEIEYWTVYKNKKAALSYQFKGNIQLGEIVIYNAQTGLPFEKFVFNKAYEHPVSKEEVNSVFRTFDYTKMFMYPYRYEKGYLHGVSQYIRYANNGQMVLNKKIESAWDLHRIIETRDTVNPFSCVNTYRDPFDTLFQYVLTDTTSFPTLKLKQSTKEQSIYQTNFEGINLTVMHSLKRDSIDAFLKRNKINSSDLFFGYTSDNQEQLFYYFFVGEKVNYQFKHYIVDIEEFSAFLCNSFPAFKTRKFEFDEQLYSSIRNNKQYSPEVIDDMTSSQYPVIEAVEMGSNSVEDLENFDSSIEPVIAPRTIGSIEGESEYELGSSEKERPSFPNGDDALMKFLRDNIQYPKKESDKKIEGRVIVGFSIAADGTVSNIKIINGVSTGLDREAVRVIALMPKWVPATKNGKNVSSHFILPVVFKLK